jgi:hypothetical protein
MPGRPRNVQPAPSGLTAPAHTRDASRRPVAPPKQRLRLRSSPVQPRARGPPRPSRTVRSRPAAARPVNPRTQLTATPPLAAAGGRQDPSSCALRLGSARAVAWGTAPPIRDATIATGRVATPAPGEMDVTFATPRGREFTLEVWYFATVREVKEAVRAREGVPVGSQRLFLAGRELDDDARDAAHYGVLQGSRVLLLLPDDATPPSAAAAPAAVRVAISAPAIGRGVALDLRAPDTVARLKELLQDRTDGALPAARTALFYGKAEMEDAKALADYDPPADSMMEVCAVVRQPPAAAAAAGGGNGARTNQQRIAVKVKFGARAVALEVGATDVVRDLRKEVERLRLPVRDGGGGYFFVYKQNVMDEDRTLRWHEVKNGDTIEIFNGTVTGGA